MLFFRSKARFLANMIRFSISRISSSGAHAGRAAQVREAIPDVDKTEVQDTVEEKEAAPQKISTDSILNKVGVFENLGTSTVSGTTVTVNLNTGNFFEMDLEGLSGNVDTFTISNATQEDGMISCFIVKITQGTTTTDRQFTWSSIVSNGTNIDWAGGEGPEITSGADKVDILSFTTYDKGSTWYGAPVGQEFS